MSCFTLSKVSTFLSVVSVPGATVGGMCRNITALRGLEPAATTEEIRAAALQYVRKVAGISAVSDTTRDAIERAVAEIAESTTRLLAELWSAQGLHHDAARLFVELAKSFAEVEVAPQQQGAAWLAAYAVAVARAGDFVRRSRIRRTLDAVTGAVLVAFGLRLATERA